MSIYIPTPHEVSLVTTGGTAASDNTGDEFSLKPRKKDFAAMVEDELREEGIAISDTYPPYCILSENTTYDHILKLVGTFIEVIDSTRTKTVATVLGTDALEKVANILGRKPEEDRLIASQTELFNLLTNLHTLTEQHRTRIVITGSNTTDLEEIRSNIINACCIAADNTVTPGTYVSFGGRLVEGGLAVKDVYDGTANRYTEETDPEYQARLAVKKQEGERLITALYDHFQAPRPTVEEPPKANKIDPWTPETFVSARLKQVRYRAQYPFSRYQNGQTQLYDCTKILRANHEPMCNRAVSDGMRAVVLQLFHGGTANTSDASPHLAVDRLVRQLRTQAQLVGRDIVFFGVTQNYEPTTLDAYETSVRLRKAGVVPLYNMPKDVACEKAHIVTPRCKTPADIIRAMLQNAVGEIDPSLINRRHIDELIASYS